MNEAKTRFVGILAVIALCAGTLYGCGPTGCSSPQATDTAEVTQKAEQKVFEGTLYSFDGSQAVVHSDGTKYPLNLSNASINSSSLNVGDVLAITYEGKLDAKDSSTCNVVAVETKKDAEGSHEAIGTLEDISMNSVTLRTANGDKLTFNANNAEHSFAYGLDKGNWTTVVYTGDLQGTDTSNISVVRIHDMDTDRVKDLKAQTTIQEVNETAYALQDVELHDNYMMASNVVGSVKGQVAVKVTGHCSNGWDRVTFDGKEAYVYGSYLTAQANESSSQDNNVVSQKVHLKKVNETVYAKTDATVRAGYSTSAEAIGALKAGASIVRTGICDNGWSRVTYNGREAFVYSELLTTKNPNSEVKGVKVTAVNETVYVVVDDANVRASWSTDSNIVGDLKYGAKASRTGICDNGWSRIVYNGKDAYINSDLISKNDPNKKPTVTVYKVTGVAWTTTDCEVRDSYSANAKSLGKLAKGDKVSITGVTDNNWSRIDYNGKVAFINNDMLTSVDPNPAPKADEKKDEGKKEEQKADEKKADEQTAEEQKAEEKQPEQPQDQGQDQGQQTPTDDKQDEATQTDDQTDTTGDDQAADDQGTDQGGADAAGEQGNGDNSQEATTDGAEGEQSGEPEEPQAENQADVPIEEHEIEGIVLGYSMSSITIQVTGDNASGNTGDADFDNAKGEAITLYTFDISNASQEYSKGVDEGIAVKVSYTGELSSMESVHATKVTDSGVKQPSEVTYRGTVVSTTENTVTVQLSKDIKNTFNFEATGLSKDDLADGATVVVTADVKDAKLEDNVFKATKIQVV